MAGNTTPGRSVATPGTSYPARALAEPPSCKVPAVDHDERCALLSRDEPLAGSGPEAPRWLLVEDPGPWGRDGLADGRLPGAVRAHLATQVARHDVRHQALRRVSRGRSALRTVVLVNLAAGWAARTQRAPEDLVDLDLAAASAAHPPPG